MPPPPPDEGLRITKFEWTKKGSRQRSNCIPVPEDKACNSEHCTTIPTEKALRGVLPPPLSKKW